MPAVFTYQDLSRLEAATEPHGHLALGMYVKAIAFCEDVLHDPNGLPLAQLTELGPPRHASAAASSICSARLGEVTDGFVRIPDFARYSGAVLLDHLEEQLRKRRRRRAAKEAAHVRHNGKGQLDLLNDAFGMRLACDPPQTPPKEGRQEGLPPYLPGRKEGVGVEG